ncbi:abortive infection family protein [Pandoraea bronchicola]|uniref:Abortive infection protein-like C-terminal domain-containing protein n=1 Tax=Pandoraea bronchicola TaxID=2508287 RepID=A0A5E5BQJ6_9BURK|nr:abortive infection family protein [Pandoraea bronchicola]VVE88139.1 hypothetical protein PBR20603_02088 [Pandoraea bronchicola]
MEPVLPIDDSIIAAVAQLIDDSKGGGERREPSHSEIDFYISRANLSHFDPKAQGQTVGKAKRVRATLHSALEECPANGSKLIGLLMAKVRACGGFRHDSPNFVGIEAITNAQAAFASSGIRLLGDGQVLPLVLSNLKGRDLTKALQIYAERAQRGAADAALVTGTGKDLLEAVAAHVVQTIFGHYSTSDNFQILMGSAFAALNLAVPETPLSKDEPAARPLERALFQSAVAVNKLRNREGTGHGRPWVTSLTDAEAKAAIETAGTVSTYLLAKLKGHSS